MWARWLAALSLDARSLVGSPPEHVPSALHSSIAARSHLKLSIGQLVPEHRLSTVIKHWKR
ncbi:hypothetical protein [Bacillus sp. FJAT-27264]|uniref:hypothetical protein n=1 Tax=Paenibacillus sp. (strain DSM 101736 / FJAT-27264) TaxID=1850362 RepID=UPI0011122DB6|nr:hypothetical protein [Bacillus sp. FJAT-27264]